MNLLRVEGLTKRYPGFLLDDVSFAVGQGEIMGLIGRNGAGKSTTLKAMLNMVRPDAGRVEMFGRDFFACEALCKQDIGVVFGDRDFFPYKRLSLIAKATGAFYQTWDDGAYRRYLKMFELDENKRVKELSSGMKVKYLITLALSHHAKLFVFDEPTSGLDPVAREDLLGLFSQLVKDGTRSILFSTHITSDLDKCADSITYIMGGRVVESAGKDDFVRSFQRLRTPDDKEDLSLEEIMIRNERRSYAV